MKSSYEKRRQIMMIVILFSSILLHNQSNFNSMQSVYAATQSIQYEYDSLGRVKSAKYPSGKIVKYEYDSNGNMKSVTYEINSSDNSSNLKELLESRVSNHSILLSIDEMEIVNFMHYSAEEVKQYNAFKKKKPVIKSFKARKKKSNYYVKVQIKKVANYGVYGETGYQVKYATNDKFKKAKTLDVKRKKKGSITGKQWKVKKNKTYYVKVRAYMKTKTGKKVYTKYSKVKKVKVE